ncbi:MAG TPA: hypothetical protein VIQ24_04985 [Pyrinomonadaceae bacterium]
MPSITGGWSNRVTLTGCVFFDAGAARELVNLSNVWSLYHSTSCAVSEGGVCPRPAEQQKKSRTASKSLLLMAVNS